MKAIHKRDETRGHFTQQLFFEREEEEEEVEERGRGLLRDPWGLSWVSRHESAEPGSAP